MELIDLVDMDFRSLDKKMMQEPFFQELDGEHVVHNEAVSGPDYTIPT